MSEVYELLSLDDAKALLEQVFTVHGVSHGHARSVASALVAAEIDGQVGHGFSRVSSYIEQIKSGKVKVDSAPSIDHQTDNFMAIDAGNGFAFPAIDLAINQLIILAQKQAIVAIGIKGSHHCGQLGAHVERLAEHGLVALMMANSPKAMAPWGGSKPLFGTNPLAFAAPRLNEPPLVIDLSMSHVARGKVMAASKRGDSIPEGWAFDIDGNPTTDPKAALKGTMAPAGGAKGAALALMIEIFAATLTGAHYSYEASSFLDSEGSSPNVGQFIIALNPQQTGGIDFGLRLEALITEIESQEGVRLPGSRRIAIRQNCKEDGLKIPQRLLSEIKNLIHI